MPGKETLDIDAMYAAFKRVKIHIGLIIDEIRITGKSAHLVREPFGINLEEPAQIEAEILQEDIQAFLTNLAPGGLQNFKVRIDEGKVFIDATMQVLVANVPVSAVCTLRIEQGKSLFIDLESVTVAPKSLVQKQLDSINPVFDLSALPVDGLLLSVDAEGGKALLKGQLSPKAETAATPAKN